MIRLMRTQIFLHGGIFMTKSEENFCGMRVVPLKDFQGVMFGQFEGIVIASKGYDYCSIEISKMVKKDGGYFVESAERIPSKEVIEHSESGTSEAEFLFERAKKIRKSNEDIAITDRLVGHLMMLNASSKSLQSLKTQRT